jgi:hypothetical protein
MRRLHSEVLSALPALQTLILRWAARPGGVSNAQVHAYCSMWSLADINEALSSLREAGLIAIAAGCWYRRQPSRL